MKTRTFLLLFVVVICVPVTAAQQSREPASHPFVITNVKTAFAIQGYFEGEYRVYEDQIALHVTKSFISLSDHCPYDGRRLITAVKFGLAESTAISWKPRNLVGLPLSFVMVPKDRLDLGEMDVSIPREVSMDLTTRWLVVQIDETTLDGIWDELPQGVSFAHSRRDLFARP